MSAARALASSANAKNIQTSRRSLSCARGRSRAVVRARRERTVESREALNANVAGLVTGRRATNERRGVRASAMMGDGDRGARGERDDERDGEEDEEVGGRRRRRRASRGVNKDASASDEKKGGKKKTQTMAAESKGETETEAPSDAEGGSSADFIENVVMDAREESFALKKKRMELIIEEKEWDLESPTSSEDEKMIKLVEYVNAVEAFKELCSSEVPNTVGDLLGQYVTVYHLDCDSPGYDEALAFLGIDPDEDEDEDERDKVPWLPWIMTARQQALTPGPWTRTTTPMTMTKTMKANTRLRFLTGAEMISIRSKACTARKTSKATGVGSRTI